MGFWAVYMGLYGGGTATVATTLIITVQSASADTATAGGGIG